MRLNEIPQVYSFLSQWQKLQFDLGSNNCVTVTGMLFILSQEYYLRPMDLSKITPNQLSSWLGMNALGKGQIAHAEATETSIGQWQYYIDMLSVWLRFVMMLC
jgi:hypothetical protein